MSEGPVSGRRIKRRTLRTVIIGVAAVVLVAGAIVGFNIYSKQSSKQETRIVNAELNDISDSIASEVSAYFAPLFEQLDNLDYASLIEVIKAGDKTAMSAKADSLLDKFSGGLKVRLFKTGEYDLDRSAKPPLGFASVAMLRNMEKSEADTGVELHLANTDDRHVVVIRKLADKENNLIGLLHISLDPAPLLNIIAQQESGGNYVELMQTTGGNSLVLAKSGTGALPGKPVTAAVEGTSFTINVWGGDSVAAGNTDAPGNTGGSSLVGILIDNAVIILAVILVVVVAGYFVSRRNKPEQDQLPEDIVYGGAVLAIMEGAHPGLEKLVPNLPNLGQTKTIRPLSQGLIDDDVTVIEKPPPAKPLVKPKSPGVKSATGKKAPVAKKTAAPEPAPDPEQPATASTTVDEKPDVPEEEDLSMAFEMPGTETAAAPKPKEKIATPEEMSLEFDPLADNAAAAKTKAEDPVADDSGDMSLEFEMPGAQTPAAPEPKEKVAAAEEMSLEFDMPGAETSTAEDKADVPKVEPEEKVATAEEMSLEFEMPGAETSASEDKTDVPVVEPETNIDLPGEEEITASVEKTEDKTDVPEDPGMEFELPAADSTPPEDLSMEFELPGSEDTTTPQDESPGTTSVSSDKKKALSNGVDLAPEVFRAYDIRGVVGTTLSPKGAQDIGMAMGSEARARGQATVIVGRDGRISSPDLANALIQGLISTGCDVIDIGVVPTPVLYFATHHLDSNSGVMITGSHNGPEYNGFKIILAGEKLTSAEIQALYTRIVDKDFTTGEGKKQSRDISDDYIARISEDIPVALGGVFKIVIDCGNGVAGDIAPKLFKALGHDIIEMYCDIDGNFPNHHPDPSQPENLEDLIAKVKEVQADIGIAFDGDADRLGVVDGNGKVIWPDRQLMLFAKDVLSRNPGKPIIFDTKCSRHLKTVIEKYGGTPVMWKTGHTFIKEKLKEMDAPLAGELSGHIFFKERWYGFDDAIYAGARLIEALAACKQSPAEIFAELPEDVSTPEIRINLKEKHHAKFMKMLRKKMKFDNAEITDIDGVRVDFPDGWGLIRPSNTTPCLIARFEAEDEKILSMIQARFRDLIHAVAPNLKIPF